MDPENVQSELRDETESIDELADFLVNFGGINRKNIFKRLRIPSEDGDSLREIKLVFISHHCIYCVNVLNIQGSIRVHGDMRYLEQTQVNGRQVIHNNPIGNLVTGLEMLRDHVARSGMVLEARFFVPRLIFMSENAMLDEELINDDLVIPRQNLMMFLDSLNSSLIERMSPRFITGQLSSSQMKTLREKLSKVGTWDILELNDGSMLLGDYRGCVEISFDRDVVEELNFSREQNYFYLLFCGICGSPINVKTKLLKRDGGGIFGHDLVSAVTLPESTRIAFHVKEEGFVRHLPVGYINYIKISK